MWAYNYSTSCSEIYHHGIKGQKWGVRRFQKKDGSYTSLGRKRRQKLEAKYKEKGMSNKDAQEAAAKRAKVEKIIAASAGVTLAAAAAYGGYKYSRDYANKVIKSGTKIQVIANDSNKDLNRPYYFAYKKGDAQKYRGLYGDQLANKRDILGRKMGEGKAFKIDLEAASDIKVASNNTAAKAFMKLYRNDEDFRNLVTKDPNKKSTDRQLKKAYDDFNRNLVFHEPNTEAAAKKFYGKLKEQGFQGVMDVNDQKYSGYKAKRPVIVFDKLDTIKKTGVKQLNDKEIAKDKGIAYAKIFGGEIAKTGAKYGALIGGIAGMNRAANKRAINKYKKEHPKTKMTDEEILEMLRNQN